MGNRTRLQTKLTLYPNLQELTYGILSRMSTIKKMTKCLHLLFLVFMICKGSDDKNGKNNIQDDGEVEERFVPIFKPSRDISSPPPKPKKLPIFNTNHNAYEIDFKLTESFYEEEESLTDMSMIDNVPQNNFHIMNDSETSKYKKSQRLLKKIEENGFSDLVEQFMNAIMSEGYQKTVISLHNDQLTKSQRYTTHRDDVMKKRKEEKEKEIQKLNKSYTRRNHSTQELKIFKIQSKKKFLIRDEKIQRQVAKWKENVEKTRNRFCLKGINPEGKYQIQKNIKHFAHKNTKKIMNDQNDLNCIILNTNAKRKEEMCLRKINDLIYENHLLNLKVQRLWNDEFDVSMEINIKLISSFEDSEYDIQIVCKIVL